MLDITPLFHGELFKSFQPQRVVFQLKDAEGLKAPYRQIYSTDIQVSKNGNPFVNGCGVVGEIGEGYYFYQVPEFELDVPGTLLIRIKAHDCREAIVAAMVYP